MTDASAPPIEVRELTKYYGDVRGIEDLTFAVDSGEVFGFLGPNGAGKSTMIRVLLGLLKPTDGEARVLGHDVTDREELLAAKRRLGYLPSDVAFYDRVTGTEILDYFGRIRGDERREELLDRFPVPLDRPVKAYSSGNRQKLAIVATFMHDPELTVMDEPTSGLDPLVQNEFYALLDEQRERGRTTFFSSHILSEVRRVCDRVGIVRDGRLIELDTVAGIIAESGTVVRVRLAEAPPAEELTFPGVANVERVDGGDGDGSAAYTLVLSREFDALIDALARYTVEDLEVREAALEDVFMHFYGGEDEEGAEPTPEGERIASGGEA
ncbi:ABC transporter ATP-binding protein [Salinilacihabitans rarus]|uniref:ABC transporter ATP-binding protein n=1 Tax=Salinilacihabitans rarus TaxID=2961596 RepID=UPI0020C84604|nr:ABC transporter ATP-binding protein [Salinilacihabitans rarus]